MNAILARFYHLRSELRSGQLFLAAVGLPIKGGTPAARFRKDVSGRVGHFGGFCSWSAMRVVTAVTRPEPVYGYRTGDWARRHISPLYPDTHVEESEQTMLGT
jgi:hypothetical protein